jgi:hypothetical protein
MEDERTFTCSTCHAETSESYGGIEGNFGIIPVAFCVTCTGCIFDMVAQLSTGQELDS